MNYCNQPLSFFEITTFYECMLNAPTETFLSANNSSSELFVYQTSVYIYILMKKLK